MNRRRFLLNNPTYYVDYVIKDDVVGEQFIGFLNSFIPAGDREYTKEEFEAESFIYKTNNKTKKSVAYEYYFNGKLKLKGVVDKDNYTLNFDNELGEKVLRVYSAGDIVLGFRGASYWRFKVKKDIDNHEIIKYIDLRFHVGSITIKYFTDENFPQLVIGDLSQYNYGYSTIVGYGFKYEHLGYKMLDDAINLLGKIAIQTQSTRGIHIEHLQRTEESDDTWNAYFGREGNIAYTGTTATIRNHLYWFARQGRKNADYDELRSLFYTGELNKLT
ncbi:hypothetical protein [Ornithobacterium rhinotracheale]|uniref:hypothetical protein n=1 Tax=Ornithobacterium rhinotracheale TaxID=28251 RepID=UPI001FF2A6DA|nr:hypothetical protein [Ornithobacterium rhinotracheale]MCK0199093.1 hypothetical protein [Ornithobacterium rhinotracheale]